MALRDKRPGIRDLISQAGPNGIAPGSLADTGPQFPTIGGKLLYTIGLGIDVLLEKCFQGVSARFPTVATPTALPFIGQDRDIPQGPGETTASYRVRLQGAFQAWAKSGTPWGVMENILPMLLPLTPEIRCVNDNSAWDTFFAGQGTSGPPNHLAPPSIPNWNWDNESWDPHPEDDPEGSTPAWWRWWLILYSVTGDPNAWCGPGPTIGAGHGWKIGDHSRGIGVSTPPSVIQGLRTVLGAWNKGGKWCRYLIVSFSASLFDPAQPADGTHNPAGTFGPMCAPSGGVYVPTRFSNARYCDGVA